MPTSLTHSSSSPTKYHKLVGRRSLPHFTSKYFDRFERLLLVSASSHFKLTANAWYRTHGYQPPLDIWLVFLWTIIITLTTGYFGFSLKFIVENEKYNHEQAPLNEDGATSDAQRWKLTWGILGFLAISVVVLTGVKVSLTDTTDKRVAREDTERNVAYVRTKGIPVVVDGDGEQDI
ncbi:1358_t:CDS:2, partial [Acaulospora colombiana]